MKRLLALTLLAMALPACSDSTGPRGSAVSVRFATRTTAAGAAVVPVSASVAATAASMLTVTGSNGTLVIDDIRLIVSELELERAEGSCADSSAQHGDECEEVRLPPALVVLPLDGSPVTVATTDVPAGTYTALKFKVEDVEPEGEDGTATRAALAAILAQLRATYPNFPSSGSIVLHGTFTPTGGVAQPFTVYLRADVEIEKRLVPPVTVPGANTLTVPVDPGLWFKQGTQVVDLSRLNGQTIEFEAETEHGFLEVEHGD